jgi:hypothetical protein
MVIRSGGAKHLNSVFWLLLVVTKLEFNAVMHWPGRCMYVYHSISLMDLFIQVREFG